MKKHYQTMGWLTLVTILLCSCGFHLRGQIDLPQWLTDIAIINQSGQPDLDTLLSTQLRAYNIRIINDPALAQYWLVILNESYQEHITSVSSSTTPRQYQLIYTLSYRLQSRQGKIMLPTSKAYVTREITINSNRILGSDQEEVITKNEMKQDAIMQILNRISLHQ